MTDIDQSSADGPADDPSHSDDSRDPSHGPLALVGDRPFTEGCTHEARLLASTSDRRVTLVPTAAAYENPNALIEAAKRSFGAADATVEVAPLMSRADASDPEIVSQLASASMLFFVGDSPMHLRSVLKETLAWTALVDAWKGGAPLAAAGGSAMALTDPMVDPRGGAFTVGLGIIEGVALVAQSHWSADQARRTIRLAPKGTVVAGVDATAALVLGKRSGWSTAGTGEVVVYRDGAEVGIEALAQVAAAPALGA